MPAGFIAEGFAAWRACREAFELELWRRYAIAEESTHGALLNARGRERDVEPVTLFYGPARRAYAYASEELVEHWLAHPRVTFEAFERAWNPEL